MGFGETRFAGLVLAVLAVACGTEETDNPSGGGSGGATSGGTASGGTSSGGASTGGVSSGGATTGGGPSGGSSLGGTSSTGGTNAGGASASGGSGMSGGVSAGGTGDAGVAGDGGMAGGGPGGKSGGGAAGSSGGGAGGGSSKGVAPSTGCGKSSGVPMNVSVPNSIVTFPDGYNGSTPVPMMFGFHGANRTNQDFYQVDARTRGTDLEKHFAMVYLKAAGDGWVSSDKSRLDTAYDQLTQNYCIDTNHVFATGHSSGAHFIEVLLCGGDRRFAGVALVSGSKQCASWSPVPALLIHGTNDQERVSLGDADGRQELGPFVTSNACSTSTTPYTAAMACNSIYNQAPVNNGCVSYTGCSAPFVFCSHDDQNYGATNHGWPCFANQTMYAFLSSL